MRRWWASGGLAARRQRITVARHACSQNVVGSIGASSAASGCGVMRASAHARVAGSRSRNSRLSASARVGPVVSSVTSLGALRLTIASTRSPGSSASASTNTRRRMRSRASSAAFWITMPPELVPTSVTSPRSS